MNAEHLERCSSAEWAEAVREWIIPWVLDGVDLGDDVLEIGPDRLASRLNAAGFGDIDVVTNEYAVRFRATK